MDIAKSNNISKPQIKPCGHFTSLTGTILDTNQTINFKDRYVLGDQLGWGRFGVIRACTDKSTSELLACKSIAKDRLVTVDDVRSVELEIEIMNKLSGHTNVVDLKAVYEDEEFVHLVMELCAGGELFHRIEKHGRFSEYEAQNIFRHLMRVVMYCHDKGIVHRDLKPENILLATKSLSSPIRLADFGLATYIEPGQKLHGTVGSPFYIAPEVLVGGYNQAADVWSAGVILYILLSGLPPFWGKTKSKIFDAVRVADLRFPHDLWSNISKSAKDLIAGMLCVDPSKRLTATQVLAHSWMKDCARPTQEPKGGNGLKSGHQEVNYDTLSTSFTTRIQNFSLSNGSPSTVEGEMGNSPAFTCRSSFSSFLVDNCTPCSVSGGFSFGSCCESNTLEFSSPVPSLPSFTFFSPSSAVDQRSNSLGPKTKALTVVASATLTDSGLGKLVELADPSVPTNQLMEETWQRIELQRGGWSTSGSKISGKRNHTIGLGELDLMMSDSVIRWASCTHSLSAPSLRLSLVF